MAGGVCSGTVNGGGVAVVSVGGVAGLDQTTSSAMTTAAAMMSNLFLSIGLPRFSYPWRPVLFVIAMSQLMERAQIFCGEPHPSISVDGRP